MLKLLLILNLAILGFGEVTDGTEATAEDYTVTVLNLSGRNITSLKEYDFSKYSEMQELDLSNNNIKHIKEDVFINNINLKKLNLSGNRKLELPKFSTLVISTSIEEISLANCNIKRLPSNIFDGSIYLRVIDLSGNPLVAKAIKISTFFALMKPEKVILPHLDKPMIYEVCKEVEELVFEIKGKDETDTIACSDVTETSWIIHNEEEAEEEDEEYDEEEEEPTTKSHVITMSTKANDNHNYQSDEVPVSVTDNSNGEVEVKVTTTANVNNVPSTIPRSIINVTEYVASTVDATQTRHEIAPVVPPIERHFQRALDSANQNTQNSNDDSIQSPPIIATQNQISTNATQEKSVQFEALLNDTELGKTAPSTENASSSAGTTVLIFLVVAVIVSGLAAFGYKFYKSRKYQATRTAEPVERELKEIVVDRKTNSTNHVKEKEPLMHNQTNNDNETTGNVQHNETRLNGDNTGPYQPTTTTIKPIDS